MYRKVNAGGKDNIGKQEQRHKEKQIKLNSNYKIPTKDSLFIVLKIGVSFI